MKKDDNFYRGARVLSPVNHIVIVILQSGAKRVRRTSLNAVQMAQLECRLVRAQYAGEIADYLITAAEDCTFTGLEGWINSLKDRAEQPELLNIQQNSLFGGVMSASPHRKSIGVSTKASLK